MNPATITPPPNPAAVNQRSAGDSLKLLPGKRIRIQAAVIPESPAIPNNAIPRLPKGSLNMFAAAEKANAAPTRLSGPNINVATKPKRIKPFLILRLLIVAAHARSIRMRSNGRVEQRAARCSMAALSSARTRCQASWRYAQCTGDAKPEPKPRPESGQR